MQPIFILTRTFAISAILVGAVPTAFAAPLYTSRSCEVGVSCPSATASSVWGFISAIFPNLSPSEPSPVVSQVSAFVVVEEQLNKRDDLDIAVREPEPEPMCLSAAFCKRDTAGIEAREPEPEVEIREPEPEPEVEVREPEPEPEPMCLSAAFCKREPEPIPEPEPVAEPEPEAEAEPEPMCLSAAFCKRDGEAAQA